MTYLLVRQQSRLLGLPRPLFGVERRVLSELAEQQRHFFDAAPATHHQVLGHEVDGARALLELRAVAVRLHDGVQSQSGTCARANNKLWYIQTDRSGVRWCAAHGPTTHFGKKTHLLCTEWKHFKIFVQKLLSQALLSQESLSLFVCCDCRIRCLPRRRPRAENVEARDLDLQRAV